MADPEAPPPDVPTSGDVLSDWTQSATAAAEPLRPPALDRALGFTPGTVLAGRYRVVARLGRGGMGEVYRADDVKLGQPVALKFVRGILSPALLARLYAEVRIGRQVAHPSVCRLYDVVEMDGQTFLAMEYVDGEDLASLLARIGRLPADKALEIARDLCAGLAAVHDKGIVHRDLKPANVMIDGRGRARITDFGLAVEPEAGGPSTFAGTPAYMAPEQLAGGEVSLRSDLYALGLVLYEMVAGRRFFDSRSVEELVAEHADSKGTKLSSVARLLEGQAARAIVQCLEEDPAARPLSARAVLALLPGHDPLEAAMAAGETPSPEAVAAAARVGDLAPAAAWTGLAAVVLGVVLCAHVMDRIGGRRVLPKPPEVLVDRAHAVLRRLGAGGGPHSAHGFDWDRDFVAELRRRNAVPLRWGPVESEGFTPTQYFYRESPTRLVPANRDGLIRRDDPPPVVSGMAEVLLDGKGRLLSYLAVPPQREAAPEAAEVDWRPLFEEAGLDVSAFSPVPPEWAAPVDSDGKRAWEGPYPGSNVVVRVEAASYHGRPVWYAVLPPWATASRMAGAGASPPTPVGRAGVWILALAMPVGGVLLARRNLRLGRGDRKGAFRVALYVFLAFSLARLFRADHVASFGDELWILIKVLAYPCFWGVQVWLLYMALEPYARRRWPHVLISWKRLLAGQVRDPLVGRDLLLGLAAGTVLVLGYLGSQLAPASVEVPVLPPDPFLRGDTLTATRFVAFRLFVNQFSAVLFALVFLFMLVVLRLLLRRDWVAVLAWCLLVGSPMQAADSPLEWAFGLLRAAVLLAVLMRAGLLGLAATLAFMFTIVELPLTLDLSAWPVARAAPAVAVLLAVAVYAFHASLGGKPMFGRALDE